MTHTQYAFNTHSQKSENYLASSDIPQNTQNSINNIKNRAYGLVVMTSPSHGEDLRFKSG